MKLFSEVIYKWTQTEKNWEKPHKHCIGVEICILCSQKVYNTVKLVEKKKVMDAKDYVK